MDDEIEALRQEVDELKKVTVDTNKVVHKMRRGIWWGRLWTIGLWLFFFAVSGAAYYYYAEPYVKQAESYYMSLQQQATKAQNLEQVIQGFLQHPFNNVQLPAIPSVPTTTQY